MLIDTFPAFRKYWNASRSLPVEEQIRGWEEDYLSGWPELLIKLKDDYTSQGVDWKEVAQERIFPYLDARLADMQLAHDNLIPLCEAVAQRARELLAFERPILFLIYAGIGCGAGWATSYGDSPAVLLGLENIAEEGWCDPATLESLVAHEVSHLAYYDWRDSAGLPADESPWGQLLNEGFATYCESALFTPGSLHESGGDDEDDWLEWCNAHLQQLAGEFQRTVEADENAAKFFGSWFEIEGRSQTGYFLGQQVVKRFAEEGLTLREIALLNPAEAGKTALEDILGVS